jgi:Trk K+ transport system NAD-binding subunit
MDSIIYLVFRNMRQPLLTLLLAYAISVLGLVLIPGQDAEGNTVHLGFFHAFYFVSYMSTTIGFGEIPYPFTDAQRMWVIFTIYATVISWIYAIGTLLSLIQGEAFQRYIVERRFAKKIKNLNEPFYLINGYGNVGRELVMELTDRHQRVVVVDRKQQCIDMLSLLNLRESVPAYVGDSADPEVLRLAGLQRANCAGVVALTSSNEINLKISITSKLLNPERTVICRADSDEVEKNMESFGTDYIVDPFDTFAMHLSVALQSPGLHLLREWLSGVSHGALTEPVYPPQHGKWILCGYGRFGKAVYEKLTSEGLDVVVIEATPDITGTPQAGCVVGKGTEADTLMEAGVDEAVGIVAGTDVDVDNLSIVMTAKEINPDLFVILRQNQRRNQSIVDAVQANMIMQPNQIIASRIRILLATPMLPDFIDLAKGEGDDWACELVSRIIAISSQEVPDIWELVIDQEHARAVHDALESSDHPITVGDLMRNPRDRDRLLPAIPLLLVHASDNSHTLLPARDVRLDRGDRILWCGRYSVRSRMEWTLQHPVALEYVLFDAVKPRSWIWRKFSRSEAG